MHPLIFYGKTCDNMYSGEGADLQEPWSLVSFKMLQLLHLPNIICLNVCLHILNYGYKITIEKKMRPISGILVDESV